MSAITYIGIDLAWSPRNLSGAAVLLGNATGATLHDVALLQSDADLVAYITRQAGSGPALVTVDAPLVVPNEYGRRPAEAELGRAMSGYQAAAHSANRRLLAFADGKRDPAGQVRGEALVAALAAHGFWQTAAIAAHDAPGQPAVPRTITEVYPHAAMVGMFELECTLKYKTRPRRSRAQQLAAWAEYQRLLGALATADPALHGQADLLAVDVSGLRGARLKDYEDQVDALLCAYIALYAHRWGAARCRTFGTLAAGSIFTPVPRALREPQEQRGPP
jgi:predicted RNase H-like nuclease